jgi:hypothetical protein
MGVATVDLGAAAAEGSALAGYVVVVVEEISA